ncbi:helix-turn-helix transcriptional regulator [Nonomuraea dietziae]|uniref:helix-turn-helix transcriptional regulator n=1 Tax=Nonomuraea dietziae TaxID=65515 RepID=UPI0034391F7B
MSSLGLSADQESLYRYLLRKPRPDIGTVHADLAMPRLSTVLAELRELGLVDHALTAVPPAVAVDLLVRRCLDRTRRQFTELSLAWDVLTELSEEHRSGRPVQMVEHVPDGPAVTRRLRALLADNPGEFMHLKVQPRNDVSDFEDKPFASLLAAGLRSRTLFSADALTDPHQEPYARYWHGLGHLHRVTTEPTRHLAIVNRSVAYVQADPAQPNAGGLQVRQPGLVAMLADVFDGMWTRARDLDDLPLSPLEQQVLHALTEHHTDETAARALHISVRKFRAHVADLMARLGAATRFQAALRAKERGWL